MASSSSAEVPQALAEFVKELGQKFKELNSKASKTEEKYPPKILATLDLALAVEPKHQPHLKQFSTAPEALNEPWKPTSVIEMESTLGGILHPVIIRKKTLILNHIQIRTKPYLPQAWIDRATTLLYLGYGELAVADAYRGRLLVEAFLARGKEVLTSTPEALDKNSLPYKVLMAGLESLTSSFVGKKGDDLDAAILEAFKTMENQAFTIMLQGLQMVRAWHDVAKVAQEAKKRHPDSAEFWDFYAGSVSSDLAKMKQQWLNDGFKDPAASKVGRLNRVSYPWVAEEEVERGSKAIKKVKANIQAASDSAILAPSLLSCGTEDSLGLFAKRLIAKGERILLDKSIFSSVNATSHESWEACCKPLHGKGLPLKCCKARYCSVECKTEAVKSYHRTLCGKDFSWLYKAYSNADPLTNDMVPLLMVKVLATAIQNNSKPLKVSVVGTMHAGYGKESNAYFKYLDNIVAPTKILQTLGIDIFTDRRFDSWAIQTLFLRIENNKAGVKFGKRTYSCLNPLFTMFNHACDPSAIWQPVTGTVGSSIEVRASRTINEGEEICVSYSDPRLPEKERRNKVKVHIGKVCECGRCLKERAAVAEGKPVDAFDLSDMEAAAIQLFKEGKGEGEMQKVFSSLPKDLVAKFEADDRRHRARKN